MKEKRMNNIIDIRLEEVKSIRVGPEIERERRQAVDDLLRENHFLPHDKTLIAPWVLGLYLTETHLHFDLLKEAKIEAEWKLPKAIFRSIIKDYFIITNSYAQAIQSGNTQRLEAIDMGRRGVHNEGAQSLKESLEKYVDIDLDTARRLFTLVCILHIRGI